MTCVNTSLLLYIVDSPVSWRILLEMSQTVQVDNTAKSLENHHGSIGY